VLGPVIETVWRRDRSFDLFSSADARTSLGAYIGYAVLDGTVAIEPQLGIATASSSATGLFGGAISRTDLDESMLYAGVAVRWALLSFLEPEVRGALGGTKLQASVRPEAGPSPMTADETVPFASIGLGLTLRTPAGAFESRSGSLRSVALGATVEAGYVAVKSFDLTPTPSLEAPRIRTRDADLGTLELSGPYTRLAFFLRF
jgi:hypothetical protein